MMILLASAVLCMNLTVYFEARGESDLGQQSVAQVIFNRSIQQHSPICSVVYAKHQFSWTAHHPPKPKESNPDWQRVQRNVKIVLEKHQQTNVLYFKNIHCKRVISTKIVSTGIIGKHIFYRNLISKTN